MGTEIKLEYPFTTKWRKGYLNLNTNGRWAVSLFNAKEDRTSISYARYLMSVKLGRFLAADEEVDHINNDKTDDSLENLEIVSRNENATKQGAVKRSESLHGTLTKYRYCKCERCRRGKSLWTKGKYKEYFANVAAK